MGLGLGVGVGLPEAEAVAVGVGAQLVWPSKLPWLSQSRWELV